jgi:hypothetical protein
VSRLPVRLYQFADGLFVTSLDPKHAPESLLGAEVLKVGPLAVGSALEAAKPYCSVDGPMGYLSSAPPLLELPWALEAIGAAADDRGAELTVRRRNGSEAVVKLEPVLLKPEDAASTFVRANSASSNPLPLYMKKPEQVLRHE